MIQKRIAFRVWLYYIRASLAATQVSIHSFCLSVTPSPQYGTPELELLAGGNLLLVNAELDMSVRKGKQEGGKRGRTISTLQL